MKLNKIKLNKSQKFQFIFSKFWNFENKQNKLKSRISIQNIKFIIKNLIIILFKFLEKKTSIILDDSNYIINPNNKNNLKYLNYQYCFNEFLKNSSLLIASNGYKNRVLNQIPNIFITTNNKLLFLNCFFFSFNYCLFTENGSKNLLINKLFKYCLIYYQKGLKSTR